jgi:hypothetical protein
MSTNSENINISTNNVQGKCDLKCSYNFKYSETNLTAKNNGSMIALTSDKSSSSPVTYNNQKYNVSNISIVSPSIHIFNNSPASAEIIIEHTPVTSGQQLLVGIPINSSTESSEASNLITQIIESVSNNAPAQGETTNINISGFSLDKIVPNKPFYSYTVPEKSSDWIVFPIINAISLNNSTLTSLGQIIKPYPLPTPGNGLFFNSNGPNSNGGAVGDGIYISCQPTGSSEEESAVSYSTNTSSNDLSSMLNNPTTFLIFQIIIGCIVFILTFFALNYIYNYLVSKPIKLPTLSLNKK